MSSTDVESLEHTVRHSNKCVYASLACLAFAVVVTSLGGAAVFIVLWRELQTQKALLNNHINSTQSMDTDSHTFALRTSLPEGSMFKVSCVSQQTVQSLCKVFFFFYSYGF